MKKNLSIIALSSISLQIIMYLVIFNLSFSFVTNAYDGDQVSLYSSYAWNDGIFPPDISLFISIAAGIMVFLFMLLSVFTKVRNMRFAWFFSFSFYLISILCMVSLLIDSYYYLLPAGRTIYLFSWLLAVISFLTSVFHLIVGIKTPKFVSEKAAKQIKDKASAEAIERLKTLKKLFDEGAITQEIYDEKKKKYIDLL